MKKIILSMLAVMAFGYSYSQSFSLGLKAGVSSSKLKVEDNQAALKEGDLSLGYHVGAFARIGAAGLFLQPEVYFNNTSNKTLQNVSTTSTPDYQEVKFNLSKVDVPVLVGFKFLIARVYAGPVASFLTSAKLDKNDIKDQFKSNIFGYQAGAGLDITKLTLDIRYEGQFGSISDVANGTKNINQVMFSVGFKLL